MIDLHCHILSGVDDGAKNLEDSIEMVRGALKEGIHTIVATPHHQNGKYANERLKVLQQTALLNKELQDRKIDVKILPGQEVRIYGDILVDYKLGEILTLNEAGKYIFIEFPSNYIPHYTDRILYELQIKGIIPIIVHPERNMELMENPDKLYKLVNNGALTQVTAGSLIGHFGKKIKRFSLELVEYHLTHMVASDAHNMTTRPFHLQAGYDILTKEFGRDIMTDLKENPHLIINGNTIYKEVPQQIHRKKLFSFLRSR